MDKFETIVKNKVGADWTGTVNGTEIVMTYTNANATQYYGGTTDAGVVEKEIQISSPSGLITMHNSNTYNIKPEFIKGFVKTNKDKITSEMIHNTKQKTI